MPLPLRPMLVSRFAFMHATFTWFWDQLLMERLSASGSPSMGMHRVADHGIDTDADGYGTVTGDRLYQLVRQRGNIQDRTFRIEFLTPEVRAYSFTFG